MRATLSTREGMPKGGPQASRYSQLLSTRRTVYAGVNYSILDGGLASGYLNNHMATVATGVRLKF